ncbi:MAG: rhamnan synthesis F family protein [Alsobacter sp.]
MKTDDIRRMRNAVVEIWDSLFDANWYKRHYTDSPQNDKAALLHYFAFGYRQLRNPNEFIDCRWYLNNYPDVKLSGIHPIVHYLSSGAAEGRDPGPRFSSSDYDTMHPDVRNAGINPLVHYMRHGRRERRPIVQGKSHYTSPLIESGSHPNSCRIFPIGFLHPKFLAVDGVVNSTRPHPSIDRAIRIPFNKRDETEQNSIAVMLHAFYADTGSEIIQKYLKHIPVPFSLFVTTTTERDAAILRSASLPKNCQMTEVRIVPNVGRDIAPKIVALADVYERYDLVLHVHTKKSLHDQRFANWRDYLLSELVGSEEIVHSHLALLSDASVGMSFPVHHASVAGLLNWGYNFPQARQLLDTIDVTLSIHNTLDFPSGSMFWAKSKALLPLLNLRLNVEDFPEEIGQIDGTLAHAIERTFCFFVEAAGYKWVKTTTGNSQFDGPAYCPSSSASVGNVVTNVFRPVSTIAPGTYDPMCVQAPEIARFNFIPDPSVRPRINLLIPSLDPQAIYGGLTTAIHVFQELLDSLSARFDARVIVTDSPSIDNRQSFRDFLDLHMSSFDAATRTIVAAGDRANCYLPVRKHDVFVATAWWTAHIAAQLLAEQSQFHKNACPLIYLIQDDERDFYPSSMKRELVKATYETKWQTIALINSFQLAEHMSRNFEFHRLFVLPYSINKTIRLNLKDRKRERTILFYGRRSVNRNAFDIVVAGLALWQERHPDIAEQWKVVSIGEAHGEEFLRPLVNANTLGKVSLSAYGELLSTASVGISLMLSPHPSYPPLEMASAGLATITNNYGTKDLSLSNDNIVSMKAVSSEELYRALVVATARGAQSMQSVSEEKSRPSTPFDLYDPGELARLVEAITVGVGLP